MKLGDRPVKDIVILLFAVTVSFVVVSAVLSAYFRPLGDDAKGYIYRIVDTMMGAAIALLAVEARKAKATYKKIRSDKIKKETGVAVEGKTEKKTV